MRHQCLRCNVKLNSNKTIIRVATVITCGLLVGTAVSQVTTTATREDFTRALQVNQTYREAVGSLPGPVHWIDGTSQFWLEETDAHRTEYVIVNAGTQERTSLNIAKVAEVLNKHDGKLAPGGKLQLQMLEFEDKGKAFTFQVHRAVWRCILPTYECTETGPAPMEEDWSRAPGFEGNATDRTVLSPDGKWEATIQDFNVFLRAVGDHAPAVPLSMDGSMGDYYQLSSLAWSPDSKHLLAIRLRQGMRREVQYVHSSPEEQLQPTVSSHFYAKPGDILDVQQPVLFDPATRKEAVIATDLFPNPFELSDFTWHKDSSAFTFVYNERGHQRLSVLLVEAKSGQVRRIIDETSATYIEYTSLDPNPQGTGKFYRYDINDGAKTLWLSERDGWAHLYLYDGHTGAVKNQVTHGAWVVRGVDRVDEANRQIYFEASGVDPKLDPYFTQGYRINFDGTGMVAMSTEPANHQLSYSPDGEFYTDRWSRVDLPTEVALKRVKDQSTVMSIAKVDSTKLLAAGWHPPEVFIAKGRDGKTDIWGVIWKPRNFDPKQKYPVVEDIYAGPQGSFVPKSFSPRTEPLTELGFVVVQIDGMGTNNRSKAFHDVIWKNLKDGGFEDRILWHQSAAKQFPWYDATRVGIFGTSAGGQNALGALLFHPEFYKAAAANSGSHDNRMDKIWWNEQWMGWPVGPEYAASSNIVNAWRLQGRLLLVMGELDLNVDPSTTLQVANALIKADKDFEFLDVPNGGHGAGGEYGQRRLLDFFIRSLKNEITPNWNATSDAIATYDGKKQNGSKENQP